MIEGKAPARMPPRTYEVWAKILERLRTGNFGNLLLGGGIYLAEHDMPAQEGPLSDPWGRLVVIPATSVWEVVEQLGRDVLLPFLIRVDYHKPNGSDFDVTRWSDAAHVEAFRLLHGWRPTGMQYARVDQFIHRQTPPQPMPIWDGERDTWARSATYHVFVSPPPLEE